jgi:hypothetical protein
MPDIDGTAVRVVELAGESGELVFCHPTIVRCVAPNRGAQPRFMRVRQQLTTRARREFLIRAMHPRYDAGPLRTSKSPVVWDDGALPMRAPAMGRKA